MQFIFGPLSQALPSSKLLCECCHRACPNLERRRGQSECHYLRQVLKTLAKLAVSMLCPGKFLRMYLIDSHSISASPSICISIFHISLAAPELLTAFSFSFILPHIATYCHTLPHIATHCHTLPQPHATRRCPTPCGPSQRFCCLQTRCSLQLRRPGQF